MTLAGYDSIDPAHIPTGAPVAMGYVDGRWPDFAAEAARLTLGGTFVVSISCFATDDADMLDVEAGNATPDQAPGWVLHQRAHGADPVVYCSASAWPAVRAAFWALNLREPAYGIADYDGDPSIDPSWLAAGCVGKQYRSDTAADLDYWTITEAWPGLAAHLEDAMQPAADCLDPTSGGLWALTPDGAVFTDGGAPYLGGLNNHPDYHAGGPSDPAFDIRPWFPSGPQATPADQVGYTILTRAPDGVHFYHFPRDGSLAKPGTPAGSATS